MAEQSGGAKEEVKKDKNTKRKRKKANKKIPKVEE